MIGRIEPTWLRRTVMVASAPVILVIFIVWHGAENLGEFAGSYRECWRGDQR